MGQCTGGDCESCARYRAGDEKRASHIKKREGAVYGRKVRWSLQDQAFSGTGPLEDDTAVHGKRYENEGVVRSNGRVAMDLVGLLEKDTMGTFMGLLRYIVEEQLGNLVCDYVRV